MKSNPCKQIIASVLAVCAFTMTSMIPVSAAPPINPGFAVVYVGPGMNLDCGTGATYCPAVNLKWDSEGGVKPERLLPEFAGEKPIPVRPGYTFVDWEITTIATDGYNIADYLKVGDVLSNWNSYRAEQLFSYTDWKTPLNLRAIWTSDSPEQDSKVPIKISIPSTPINVTLPATIDFTFLADSVDAVSASNIYLKNNSKVGNIKISNVKTLPKTGWALKPKGAESYFKVLPLDSKEIYIGLSKDASISRTYTDISSKTFTPADWKAAPNGTLPLYFEAKTGAVSSELPLENAADIIFTLAYEKAV